MTACEVRSSDWSSDVCSSDLVARVLFPSGLFYFDTWNLAHPVGWRRFDFEVNQAAQQPPDQRKDVARNQFCTPQEVELYVRAVGLEPVLMLTDRSEEHTSELQSLMRISYAVFCLKKNNKLDNTVHPDTQ